MNYRLTGKARKIAKTTLQVAQSKVRAINSHIKKVDKLEAEFDAKFERMMRKLNYSSWN